MIGFRFRTIIRPYYRGAAGIVLAYDVTDAKTFQNVEDWITSIYENTQTCQIIQKVLLANKIDLPQGRYLPGTQTITHYNLYDVPELGENPTVFQTFN